MSEKKVVHSPTAPEPIGPYSQAIKAGDTLYVSGQIPIDAATGQLVDESIELETEKVMQNLEAILIASGMGFTNVVKCTIFLKDMNQFSAINAVYGNCFQGAPPARETVEVSQLPKGVNVEISCIAVQ